MGKLWTLVVMATFLFCATNSIATTWGSTTVQDPLTGDQCEVKEPASYGSYIYSWPSKYDGVYWPFTDENWLWECEDSGYISFGDDFSDLTDDEISRIRKHLSKASSQRGSDLKRLEAMYRLRDKDDKFWAWFYRVKAVILTQDANAARYEALQLMEASVETMEPGFDLIQTYYLIGEYHRIFGKIDKAKTYFSKARSVEWQDDEGNAQTGSEYINKLIDERVTMFPVSPSP
ncbi:MAG: hypothetical protein AAGL69_02680 [Pseudomonadota bacterium]